MSLEDMTAWVRVTDTIECKVVEHDEALEDNKLLFRSVLIRTRPVETCGSLTVSELLAGKKAEHTYGPWTVVHKLDDREVESFYSLLKDLHDVMLQD